MALNESLVKFGYGLAAKASTAAGHISFATDTRQIFVGDGSTAMPFAGNVKDAVFADGILTIKYNNGADAVLDFTDVASAEGVNSLLATLRSDINKNTANISTLSGRVDDLVDADASIRKEFADADKALDASLKTYADGLDASIREDFAKADASIRVDFELADSALDSRLQVIETAVGEGGNVDTRIETAINALDSSKQASDASNFVTVNVEQTDGVLTSLTVSTSDVASAQALANVKATADAAATDASFQAYKTSNDTAVQANATAIGEVSTRLNGHAADTELHVTKDLQDRWNAAATDIEAFMKAEDLGQSAIDTLTEIQQYIAKDASAADEMVKNIAKAQQTADKGVADASAAQGTADQALALGQAAATSTDFVAYKNSNDAALAAVKVTADAAAVKTSVDASLALKADKTQVTTDIATAKTEAINAAASDAASKANTAESNAKAYADAIKVNGQAQSGQAIIISGADIKVAGDGANKDATVAAAIKSLEEGVAAASVAGVQSVAVATNSANYAEFDSSKGAVTLTIKKVALADASENNTGVADAYDVKTSIATAKSEAISAVQGEAADASNAATVAGAKKYAQEYADGLQLRWVEL